MPFVLLALAIGPGLIFLHLVWAADRHREPVWNVMLYVAAGAGILQLAVVLEGLVGVPADLRHAAVTNISAFVTSMFVVGLVEEGAKLYAVAWRGFSDAALDEPFDWLVYAVAVSLGFATLENLFFVLHGGVGVGLVRAFSAVPVHALCGTLMGTWLAEAKQAQDAAAVRWSRALALVEPALWHGSYDSLCGFMARGSAVAVLAQFVLVTALCRQGYRRTQALRDANPGVPRPPILYPEVVLNRRRRSRAVGDGSRLRHATSLAEAMRGEIPAEAPARRRPRPGWFRRG